MNKLVFIYLLTFADGTTLESPLPGGLLYKDAGHPTKLITSANLMSIEAEIPRIITEPISIDISDIGLDLDEEWFNLDIELE